ncbi:alpha/beta-hydrolase [Trichocladium antarcticum]|uniref:Alpha/beta-hydrolase n=1 Tax=Trichocladium antarcticum TaxID=1450529 RepID=A0AAN6URR4_9PEZI|nr:alpha/beta-hydrolase [Trichocladium antarcticum]
MATRVPTQSDFDAVLATHPAAKSPSDAASNPAITLVHPDPPESTTSILLLFHGLGDTEPAFATLARDLALPGVLAIAVRGTAPLPDALLPDGLAAGYHWGDDMRLDGDGLDDDPGFEGARRWVLGSLVGGVLVGRCGWDLRDILLFGFGQGGSLALGLASGLRGGRVEDATTSAPEGKAFKGVVSICGGLPASTVPSVSGLGKAKTPVLVLCGRESEAVGEDAVDLLEREFEEAKVVRWQRASDGMPRSREEVLPMMEFFAERLKSGQF